MSRLFAEDDGISAPPPAQMVLAPAAESAIIVSYTTNSSNRRMERTADAMKQRILIAEDDRDIVNLLTLYLENDGYEVVAASDGREALELARREPIDLALLDIMMPELDGYGVIRELRRFSHMPVLILSARDQDADKILGLNMGADDYLTKPFNPLELMARIRSNLRRCTQFSSAAEGTLTVGALRLDMNTCVLTKDGREIPLTPMEYKILALLMKSPNRIFTKQQIYEQISGAFFESDENTIMVHISRIREKIEDDAKRPQYIRTVRGLGYKIEGK